VLAASAASAEAPPPNVAVTLSGGQLEGARLAADPRNPDRLAVEYSDSRRERRGTCWVALSTDRGTTWTSRPFAGAGSAFSLPRGLSVCRAGAPAFGPDGTLYLAFEAGSLDGFGVVGLTRSPRGSTFEAAVAVADPSGTGGDHAPTVVVRGNRVHVAFERLSLDGDQADVLVASSIDGARTFAEPTQASPSVQNAAGSSAAIAIDRAGTVYVAWTDGAGVDLSGAGDARIEVAVSQNEGRTFGEPRTVADAPSGCGPNAECGNRYPSPSIAAPGAGLVDVAWSTASFPDPARVFVARSSDRGARWSAPASIRRPAGTEDRDQYAPNLASAPNGRVDLAYLVQARDADVGLLDVYLTRSLDGGKTFARSSLLDDAPSPTQSGDFSPGVATASSNKGVAATWIDGRRAGATEPGAEVYAAVIPDADAPSAPRVAGARTVTAKRPVYRFTAMDLFTPARSLRFRCGYDGAPLHACSRRFSQRLVPGRHTLRVVAVDSAGHRSRVTRVVVIVRPSSVRR
jgi:hypothetical protein